MKNVFIINNTLLTFSNIEEIKFTKVRDDIFSISIKSDIGKETENFIENGLFEAGLCKLDPTLQLNICPENTYVKLPDGYIINSNTFTIPINVKLLVDNETKEIFKIMKEQEGENI